MSIKQDLRNYALVTVYRAGTLPKSAESELVKIVKEVGGELGKEVEQFGERAFSYPIKGEEKGVYLRAAAALPPEALPELKEKLELEKRILRFLILGSTTYAKKEN